jgi:hypothetical protein
MSETILKPVTPLPDAAKSVRNMAQIWGCTFAQAYKRMLTEKWKFFTYDDFGDEAYLPAEQEIRFQPDPELVARLAPMGVKYFSAFYFSADSSLGKIIGSSYAKFYYSVEKPYIRDGEYCFASYVYVVTQCKVPFFTSYSLPL